MKKIFLIILLCLFNSSANAGLKEIGNSYVSQETKDKINIQLEENKSKKKNKKFILYFRQMEMSIIFVIGDLPRKLQINFMEKFFKSATNQLKNILKKKMNVLYIF